MRAVIKAVLKSEKGGAFLISVAIIVVLISIISTLSLLAIAEYDHYQVHYQIDMIQQEILMRSEMKRSQMAIDFNEHRPLPGRNVEISFPGRTTTYTLQTEKEHTNLIDFMGFPTSQAIVVKTLITSKRAKHFTPARKSPVKRYTERLIQNESLAQYQYFSDNESSENADGGAEAARVKFWGPDVLHGKVHSNTDIWIQCAGGGNNNGWPTFLDMVTTAGVFRYHPSGVRLDQSGAPMLEIFRGGWFQGEGDPSSHILFEPTAELIRQNGQRPFNPEMEIVYVTINGTSYSSMYGDIQLIEVKEFPVYSWFPSDAAEVDAIVASGGNWYEDSDHIWTNYITIYDTLWIQGPGGALSNGSIFVESELWIEGDVGGKQTWGCSDTIYIVGDITYVNTTPGEPPDDPENPNLSDYFGLVSEQKILIRYKHRDPETNEIMFPNCGNINLYGAFAAIGEGDVNLYGDMACHYDGIFTFQYHHCHGSTPSFWAQSPYPPHNDTLYDYVDLHKYIFPISVNIPTSIYGFALHGAPPPDTYPCGYNYPDLPYFYSYPNNNSSNYVYPYGTDYPWYNPVWPEERHAIYYERGAINMWGAIAQRRRGFVHRSGSDDYNHPPSLQGDWDLDVYHFDGDHPSTGYSKNYHYDDRFMFVQPPDYPQIYRGWGGNALSSFDQRTWYFKIPPG